MADSTTRHWVFRSQIDVRFRDCDAMGHVNHAVYFTYIEQARWHWWRGFVGAAASPEASIILAHAECDFRAPATFGELLEVRVAVTRVGRSSFGCAYEIVRIADGSPRRSADGAEAGRLIADAQTVQVMYDYSAGRPIPIPDQLRAELERVQS